ncbi:hypothetical protein ACFX12_013409 [Malus domestica]
MLEFLEAVCYCKLRDLGFLGNPFTWVTFRSGGIKERLDRFLATDSWKDLFPNFVVRHLDLYNSDHVSIDLSTKNRASPRRSQPPSFHFEESDQNSDPLMVNLSRSLPLKKDRVVTDYFSNIFSFTHPSADGEILDAINMKVTKDMNTSLRREFDVEDIKMAVFQMQPSTSPGLDGFPPIFFQIFWSIVGEDVLAAILSFLNLGNLLKKVNFTYITLIPKVKTPKDMSQL